MQLRQPSVYMLTNKRNGVLYVGVTSDLVQRIWQHRSGFVSSFTRHHGAYNLVWYERHETLESAIRREKLLKKWHRRWKLALIENTNPYWNDLYSTLL
ncbi:GIY-YIG nuclease family protein [Dyella humi]|uniref:GIY-YIG nuclease family protein n=2 Tax=Dyella humi TaxID=1770547 RepID=A0ABW8ILC8_9GAMM